MSLFDPQERFLHMDFSYIQRIKELNMGLHTHKPMEIMYVIDGKCEIEICNRFVQLMRNQFIFIHRNVPHRLIIEQGTCRMLCLELICTTNPEGLDLADLKEKCPDFAQLCKSKEDYLILNDTQNLVYSLKEVIGEAHERTGDSYMMQIMLARMLIGLSRCYRSIHQLSGILYINKAKEYILNNLESDLTVRNISEHVGINETYLQVLFHDHLGSGVKSYVNALRMEKARHLLISTDMSITQLAFAAGFNSRQHFGHTFVKNFQLSPLQYRKNYGIKYDVTKKQF